MTQISRKKIISQKSGSGDGTIPSAQKKYSNYLQNTFEAFGDSITVGQNATSNPKEYVNLLADFYNKAVVNSAVSGRGIFESAKNHYANVDVDSTIFSIVMAGFNDVRRGGSNVKTTAKIINGYRAIIANQFMESYIPASTVSSQITTSGTWITYGGGIAVGAKTALGAYTVDNGGYIEYTFNGTNVVIGLIAGDGVTEIHGDFTISIDGVSQGSFTENNQTDGISDGSNDNARSAMAIIFKELTDEEHTIRLTSTTSNAFIVDYFGQLKDPKFCNPILLLHSPKMDSIGYATAPNLANDTIINTLNGNISDLLNYFPVGYPIFIAETNSYYDITNGLDSDHIHPNDIGHDQIFKAAKYALANLPYLGETVNVLPTNNTFTGFNTFNKSTTHNEGVLVRGAFSPEPVGSGIEFEVVSNEGIMTTYDRDTSTWLPQMFRSLNFDFKVSNTTQAQINQYGILAILPTYANEAAAIVGGLPQNQLYKTSTGEIRIKL